MTDKNTIPNDWTIIEPGLIRLATTDIHIRFSTPGGRVVFGVERQGVGYGMAGTLDAAKEHAMKVVNELLLMGIDP